MELIHNAEKSRFELYDDERALIGEIAYRRRADGALRATHTRVFPGHEGQGHAGRLLDALAAYAEAQGARVIPECAYVAAMFKKYPDKYAAVIPPGAGSGG